MSNSGCAHMALERSAIWHGGGPGGPPRLVSGDAFTLALPCLLSHADRTLLRLPAAFFAHLLPVVFVSENFSNCVVVGVSEVAHYENCLAGGGRRTRGLRVEAEGPLRHPRRRRKNILHRVGMSFIHHAKQNGCFLAHVRGSSMPTLIGVGDQ